MQHKNCYSAVPVCTKTQESYILASYHNDIQKQWVSPLSQEPGFPATSALAARD